MNLFALDEDPIIASTYHYDRHIIKMPTEAAQLLSTSLRLYLTTHNINILPHLEQSLYKSTSSLHPISRWILLTKGNWEWTHQHYHALLREYSFRYDKTHGASRPSHAIQRVYEMYVGLPDEPLQPFNQSVTEHNKRPGNGVEAYRAYYNTDKAYLRAYKRRTEPDWLFAIYKESDK